MSEEQELVTGEAGAASNRPRLEHLAMLVCPACRAGLTLEKIDEDAQQIIRCAGCGRRYPIVDGLPILLCERALK